MKIDNLNLSLNQKLEVDDEFKEKAITLLQRILDQEHDHSEKKQIKDQRERLQFACPYCGDSQKVMRKKRSNLFWDTLFVHCFNDGCPSPHVDFATFLTDFGISREEIREYFGSFSLIKKYSKDNQNESSKRFKRLITDNSVKGDSFSKIEQYGILQEDFKRLLNASDIKPNTKIFKYLKSRNQHNNLNNFLVNRDGLLVLNQNASRDRVIGYQVKTFNTTNPYITYDLERIYTDNLGREIEEDKDMIMRMNELSTLFNIMKVRLTGKLTAFEGPMDSFLYPNAIALCSATRDTSKIEQFPRIQFMYDNDKAGREQAAEKIERELPVFLWKKFLKDFKFPKDLKDFNDVVNYAIRSKIKFFRDIDNYYSSYTLDKFYI